MKEIDSNINLGKDTENDFKESNSITVLKNIVEKNHKIKARTSETDKIPNLDGKLMLLDSNLVERITIEVQIKTLPSNYNNKVPYSYVCDTKVFNVVRFNTTLNPVVLIMVDIVNEKIYWKHISKEYAGSLNIGNQNNKTIKFTEEDLFIETDFINKMESIYNTMSEKMNSDTLEKSIISTNVTEKSIDYIELQLQVDRLNDLFNNELKCIKEMFFKNVWKFGIAYDKYSNGSAIGIYMIMIGENNTLIKRFDPRQGYQYMSMNFQKVVNIKDYINEWIEKVVKKYYLQVPLQTSNLSNEVLNEIVFNFLDNLTITIRDFESSPFSKTYYKDEESLDIIINYINGLEMFFEEIMKTKGTKNESNCVSVLSPCYEVTGKFLIFNPLVQFNDIEKELLRAYLNKVNPSIPLKFYSSNCNVELSLQAIIELQKRKINKIKRVWINKDWEACKKDFTGTKCIRTGYSKNDLFININKYFDILENNYNYTVQKMGLSAKECITDEHTFLLDKDHLCHYSDFIRENDKFEIKKIAKDYDSNKIKFTNLLKEKKYNYNINSNFDSLFLLDMPLYHSIKLLIYVGIAQKEGYKFKGSDKIFDNISLEEIPIINYYIK